MHIGYTHSPISMFAREFHEFNAKLGLVGAVALLTGWIVVCLGKGKKLRMVLCSGLPSTLL